MMTRFARLLPSLAVATLLTLVAGCAPAPIYTVAPGTAIITPTQVAQTPEQYQNQTVIWGGTVVRVENFSDHTDVELLAYPLDRSQRPRIARDKGIGRFIAVLPGYVEPLSLPPGSPVTVRGTLDGVHAGQVGEASYVFPRVKVEQHHAWTAEEMRQGHPNFSFGMGVGVGSGGRSGVGVGVGVH
ncbi:hypothetical protein HF690_02655 [Oleiagrimonas citrea]|uniref:Outer membrane lipoprotein n=2 Tax=Oleiagrimonas citrea TaxID=1665687 RepID=A0A846ZJY2_9GAMM|nr:hypothetical protein [Oleiagrimonas citrea]